MLLFFLGLLMFVGFSGFNNVKKKKKNSVLEGVWFVPKQCLDCFLGVFCLGGRSVFVG